MSTVTVKTAVERYDFEDYGTLEESGRYVKFEDYAALAAENAALKSYLPQPQGAAMMEALDAFYDREDVLPEQGMMAAFEILCCKRPQTPATEAFLAEVMASGIDQWIASRDGRWNGTTAEAEKFAAELRKGGAA